MQPKIIPPEVLEQLLSETFVSRFWSNVQIEGPDDCWIWKLSKYWHGYGQVGLGGKTSPWRSMYTHRIAWIIHNKSNIPKDMRVLHSCVSQRACCNPAHLRLGTQKDNMKDMKDQGHYGHNCGEHAGLVKLTTPQVLEIRDMYATGNFSQTELGSMFGVHSYTISQIVRRVNWKHV